MVFSPFIDNRGSRIEDRYLPSSIFHPRSSILDFHSRLSATIGSTFVARRAGM